MTPASQEAGGTAIDTLERHAKEDIKAIHL
jgi:hypothetical protein